MKNTIVSIKWLYYFLKMNNHTTFPDCAFWSAVQTEISFLANE